MAYQVFTREQWKARPSKGGYVAVRHPSGGVLHHTAGSEHTIQPEVGRPGQKWWTAVRKNRANARIKKAINAYNKDHRHLVEREKAAMRAIQAYHQSLGWTDIGYHRVIFPSGHVYLARPYGTLGAHAVGANNKLGYSCAGNYEVHKPTGAMLQALRTITEQDKTTSLVGHYKVPGNATSCPGRYLKEAAKV